MVHWLVILALVICWRASVVVYRLWFHPLSRFPGPLMGRVSSVYRSYWFLHGNEQDNQVRLHEKYGMMKRHPLIWLWAVD